jgi:hypothetical protein
MPFIVPARQAGEAILAPFYSLLPPGDVQVMTQDARLAAADRQSQAAAEAREKLVRDQAPQQRPRQASIR